MGFPPVTYSYISLRSKKVKDDIVGKIFVSVWVGEEIVKVLGDYKKRMTLE